MIEAGSGVVHIICEDGTSKLAFYAFEEPPELCVEHFYVWIHVCNVLCMVPTYTEFCSTKIVRRYVKLPRLPLHATQLRSHQ
jgi:hypothetical protein